MICEERVIKNPNDSAVPASVGNQKIKKTPKAIASSALCLLGCG